MSLQAFRKMDFNKKGVIKISDMQKFYNAYKHPKVVKGGRTDRTGSYVD